MAIILSELPYAIEALAPYISQNTIEFHYGKHHKTYVDNANKLLADTDMANASLENIIQKVAGDAAKVGIFNNCAQVWNHTFYWQCMKPGGGGKPTGAIAAKIEAAWGSFDKFTEEFKNA
ncbi:MAG: superoxide dismutase [Fe], partial [Syntrophaceae bacterium]|nr:superoxide dismutase [Fe] [Syntrophaceae bacterium]